MLRLLTASALVATSVFAAEDDHAGHNHTTDETAAVEKGIAKLLLEVEHLTNSTEAQRKTSYQPIITKFVTGSDATCVTGDAATDLANGQVNCDDVVTSLAELDPTAPGFVDKVAAIAKTLGATDAEIAAVKADMSDGAFAVSAVGVLAVAAAMLQ